MSDTVRPIIPESYDLYVPGILGEHEDEVLRQVAWMQRDAPFTVRNFTVFSMVLQHGFRHVTYASHLLESGHMYWLTDEHAEAIGQALLPGLHYLGLLLTRPQGRGFQRMADRIEEGVTVEELLIKHESGDEVTILEAEGVVELATCLKARTLHLWAAEFEPGALDALCDALIVADNETLIEIDVCDLTKPEPEDQIPLPALTVLLARNRKRMGGGQVAG